MNKREMQDGDPVKQLEKTATGSGGGGATAPPSSPPPRAARWVKDPSQAERPGGMATVEAVTDSAVMGQRRARKTLKAGGRQDRFAREGELLGKHRHPHLPRIWDLNLADNPPWLVMDWYEKSLKDELEVRRAAKKPFTSVEMLAIVEPVAGALVFLHQHGVIHRDVKPSNILIDGATVVLTDLGVAHDEQAESGLTQTGHAVGSWPYMAPEQHLGGVVDTRTDVYGLGMVAFECLMLQRPYMADVTQATQAGWSQGAHGPRERLKNNALDLVIQKAINPDPTRRHPTPAAFVAALRAEIHPITADTVSETLRRLAAGGVGEQAQALRSVADQAEEVWTELQRLLRRLAGKRLWQALAAVLVVGVLSGMALWVWPQWQVKRDTAARERLPVVEAELGRMTTERDGERRMKEVALSAHEKAKTETQKNQTELQQAQKAQGKTEAAWTEEKAARTKAEETLAQATKDLAAARGAQGKAEEALNQERTARTKSDQELEQANKALAQANRDLEAERTARAKAEKERDQSKSAPPIGAVATPATDDSDRPTWTSAVGQDKYGRWAELMVDGVVQRLRWIAPGSFQMGSPASEAERDSDETAHAVRLTRGYWLADTECTQALWQVVMGNNPSGFTGDSRLPVEQVSWVDCQQFLTRLNGKVSGLQARLPSEAQWEYACRAGTTMPFSLGGTITPDQVNYDGNYPYAGAAQGVYRRKTVPVGRSSCNPWGLFDMHGNVWEWCGDWYGDYPTGSVTDPIGPAAGSSRVYRGGCWNFNARLCRSADRLRNVPGCRSYVLGFRFCAQSTSPAGGGAP